MFIFYSSKVRHQKLHTRENVMKKATWIVVANSSLAKIFRLEKNRALTELQVLEHPQSRLHDRDLTSSLPGRTFDSVGPGRHAVQAQNDPKHMEFVQFAKQLCQHIESAREKGSFDRLFIAASPAFLGLFRQELSDLTLKLVAGEIDKDMTHMKPDEITKHLPLY